MKRNREAVDLILKYKPLLYSTLHSLNSQGKLEIIFGKMSL